MRADAHAADPLAHLQLWSHTFEALFRRIFHLADTWSDGRLVLHLGGGYNRDATTRVWAMLALLSQERALPMRLPGAWRRRWPRHALHDDILPTSPNVARAYRTKALRLLDLITPYW